MGGDQEQSSICKICKKSFANWRILGGHMRGHVTKKTEGPNFGNKSFDCFQDCEDSSYGLRENPKKTWRVSVPDRDQSNHDGENRVIVRCSKRLKEEHNCKQCGKGFSSMRALFGHMRHHSTKISTVSIQSEKSQPGLEILCPIKKKRSKLRYKFSGFCSVSEFNVVSKFSEFSGEEEAALGLVMLSSGFTQWTDFISDFDSSTNDSLFLRAKTLDRNRGELGMKLSSSVSEIGDVTTEISGQKTGKSELFESVQACSEIKSGETIFSVQDTELEVKFNANDYEFGEFNSGDHFKKPAIGDDIEINMSDSEIKNGNNFVTSGETIFGAQDADSGKFGPIRFEIHDSVSKISENCGDQSEHKQKIYNNCNHECAICFKIFPSGQALGGHKRAHFNDKNKNVEMMMVTQGSAAGLTHFSIEKHTDSGFELMRPSWAKSNCGAGPVVISN